MDRLYLALLGVMSVATFVAYWLDKRRARRGGWRVAEATLHGMELLGGWPGGLIGRFGLRHKSRKPRFYLVSWGIILLHAAAVGWWLTR